MMYSSYTKRLATAIRSMPSQLSRWVGNSNMKIHSDDAPLGHVDVYGGCA